MLLLFLLFIYVNTGPRKIYFLNTNSKVIIKKANGNYSFYKNGQPFQVKGGAGNEYIKELVSCGGNTIFCWDTSKLNITLREAEKYHVNVIIGLDMPSYDTPGFYSNQKNTDTLVMKYYSVCMRYKDSPSVLAWCLGNELTMPFSFTQTPFYKCYNRILGMLHKNDPDHPVSTSLINVPKRNLINMQWRIPALDFLCFNSYSSIKTLQHDLKRIDWICDKPYLISEWAPSGGWEADMTSWAAPIENTSTKKAEQFYDFYKNFMPVKDPRFLGSLAFYWGNRQEYTNTWYSIFDENGIPTEVKEALNDCWKNTSTNHNAPKLKYMLIDSLGAKENIIVSAGSNHRASLLLQQGYTDSTVTYVWQIVKDDWMTWGRTWDNFKKPLKENGLFLDSSLQFPNFTAPLKEGPYRVFITVYNSKGYCATANSPIYVVE